MKIGRTTIQEPLKSELEDDQFYKICALAGQNGHTCGGNITWHHAIKYGKGYYQRRWSIVPICDRAHETGLFQGAHTKEDDTLTWVALNRATIQDLLDMTGEGSRQIITPFLKVTPWIKLKERLSARFGPYSESQAMKAYIPSKSDTRLTPSRIDPFWVMLPTDKRKVVQKMVAYFEDKYDKRYTNAEMVCVMIDSFTKAILNKQKGVKINGQHS